MRYHGNDGLPQGVVPLTGPPALVMVIWYVAHFLGHDQLESGGGDIAGPVGAGIIPVIGFLSCVIEEVLLQA